MARGDEALLAALGRTDEALAALREARQTYLLGHPGDHPNSASIATLIEPQEAARREP